MRKHSRVSGNGVISDFLFYAKNHRILIHPDTRKIGIRDTLVAWGLIGLATVLFQDSIGTIHPNLNYLVQFLSAAVVLGISGLCKGIKFFAFTEESIAVDRSHELKAHLTPKERVWILLTRSIIATGGYMLYSWARVSLGIIDNSAIFSADAIVFAVLMVIVLKEKIYRVQWLGVIIASLGVSYVFIFDFQFSSFTQAISGATAGILSSFALSIIILMNTVVVQHEPPLRIAFYQCIVGVIFSLIIFLIQFYFLDSAITKNIPINEFLYAVSAGIIYGIALLFFFNAFLYTEPLVITVLGYFLTPFVAFFSWTITKEVIPARDIFSAFLISVGGALVILSEYSSDKKKSKKRRELFAAHPTYLQTLEEKMASLKRDYKLGKIHHHDYISQRHEFYKILFQFASEIRGTNIEKIEIRKKSIIFYVNPYGIKIEIDRGFRSPPFEILNFSCFENEESDFMYNLVRNGDVIFDVGARIGWYSVNLAKRFPYVQIFAFEPVHVNFSYLKKNIQHNHLSNIQPYNIALVDQKELKAVNELLEIDSASFHRKGSNQLGHRNVKCLGQRLDDICKSKNISKLDLMLCDLVGTEIKMLKGGKESIQKFKPIIVFRIQSEIFDAMSQEYFSEIFPFLKSFNYRIFSYSNIDESSELIDERDNIFFFAFHDQKHKEEFAKFKEKEVIVK